jgi:hypothetical protein
VFEHASVQAGFSTARKVKNRERDVFRAVGGNNYHIFYIVTTNDSLPFRAV